MYSGTPRGQQTLPLAESVTAQCPAERDLLFLVKSSHGKAEFAGIPAEDLHGALNRNWIRGEPQEIATKSEELRMPCPSFLVIPAKRRIH